MPVMGRQLTAATAEAVDEAAGEGAAGAEAEGA
jgi:hypothetical protein